MRVLYVTQVQLDRPFGGARHVIAVVNELHRLGHTITLAAPGFDRGLDPRIQRLPVPGLIGPGWAMETVLALNTLGSTVLRPPSVAYVRVSASSSLAPAVLHGLGRPFVLELNGCILDELRHRGRSKAAIAWVRRTLRSLMSRAAAVVAVEEPIKRHAEEEFGAPRVVVIRNGADLSVARPTPRSSARQALGLPLDRTILAFAGTLAPEVRFDIILSVLEARPELDFVVAGDGPQRPLLERATREWGDRLRWMGALPHPKAVQVLSAADVCLNLREGWIGMKPLEYAALGRRFVNLWGADDPLLASLYPDLEAIHWTHELSPEGLWGAIQSALDAERRLGPLPEGAVAQARERVSWGRTALEIQDLLEGIDRGKR